MTFNIDTLTNSTEMFVIQCFDDLQGYFKLLHIESIINIQKAFKRDLFKTTVLEINAMS